MGFQESTRPDGLHSRVNSQAPTPFPDYALSVCLSCLANPSLDAHEKLVIFLSLRFSALQIIFIFMSPAIFINPPTENMS